MSWKKHEQPTGFYVYELVDPFTNTPFYVGKGKGNRAFVHLKEALATKKRSAKLNAIRTIIAKGGEYKVSVVENGLSEKDACSLEVSLIEKYGRKNYDDGGILTNILRSTHQADFSKVVYRKGEDHHSYGKARSLESISKQITTRERISRALGKYSCACGCGAEIAKWRRYQSTNARGAHKFAEHHFDGLNKEQRRIKILTMKIKKGI